MNLSFKFKADNVWLIILVALLFTFFSREEKSISKNVSKFDTIHFLGKVDLIRVKRDTKIAKLDFNLLDKLFLTNDQFIKEFLIIDNICKIIFEYHKIGEGLDDYNLNFYLASFNQVRSGYYFLLLNKFISLGNRWEVKRGIKSSSKNQITLCNGPNFKLPIYTIPNVSGTIFFTDASPSPAKELYAKYLIDQYFHDSVELDKDLPIIPDLIPNFDTEEALNRKPIDFFPLIMKKSFYV